MEEPTFPSMAAEMPAFNWYEREVKDLLGLRPQGHPDPRPLTLHGDWPEEVQPLRKEFAGTEWMARVDSRESFMRYQGQDITEVAVGPIHAGIIEPGHFRFGAVGDTVLHLDARLFYTHRGLEKRCEGQSLKKALFVAERICGVCALAHTVAYAQAVENMAKLEAPLRAQYLRTLFLEMERLYNHIGDVGNCAPVLALPWRQPRVAFARKTVQLNEGLRGTATAGYVTLGGNAVALSLCRVCREFLVLFIG